MRGRRVLTLAIALSLSGAATAPRDVSAQVGAAPAEAIAVTANGYYVLDAVGGVFTFGAAPFHGSLPERGVMATARDLALTGDDQGYLVLDHAGGVHAFGSASFAGSLPGRSVSADAAAVSTTTDGYVVVDRVGGVHAFGGAQFFGSLPGRGVRTAAVDIEVTDGGAGYLVLDLAGGIHAFGAASFLGSLPGRNVAAEGADIGTVENGAGYYVLDRLGGVHAFGSAVFAGSIPEIRATTSQQRTSGSTGGETAEPAPAPSPTPQPLPPPTVTVTTVVSGLSIPWDVGFAPDGTLIYTERSGRLSAFVNGQKRLLAQPADVFAESESGMIGLAIDPNFASNRIVHVCQGYRSGVTKDVRVYRWQIAADWSSATRVGAPTVSGIHVTTGRHSGCRPRFGPDGFLWIGTGDAATGTNPQDLGSLAGKVLRVVASTGAAAPGNPFSPPADPRIYTYGHRNVQGLAVRPGTNQVFSAEHGPDRDDEINLLLAGGNSGWDPVPGYNEDVPMTDFNKFPGAMGASWSSGFPTTALSGITFLTGSQWKAWNGSLVGANLKGSHLRIFHVDTAGTSVTHQASTLSDRGRLRSVTQGPNGDLYVTTSNGTGDAILRLTPS